MLFDLSKWYKLLLNQTACACVPFEEYEKNNARYIYIQIIRISNKFYFALCLLHIKILKYTMPKRINRFFQLITNNYQDCLFFLTLLLDYLCSYYFYVVLLPAGSVSGFISQESKLNSRPVFLVHFSWLFTTRFNRDKNSCKHWSNNRVFPIKHIYVL